jgi:hypothetical protein
MRQWKHRSQSRGRVLRFPRLIPILESMDSLTLLCRDVLHSPQLLFFEARDMILRLAILAALEHKSFAKGNVLEFAFYVSNGTA